MTKRARLKTLFQGYYKVTPSGYSSDGKAMWELSIKYKSGFKKVSGLWRLLSIRDGYHTYQEIV